MWKHIFASWLVYLACGYVTANRLDSAEPRIGYGTTKRIEIPKLTPPYRTKEPIAYDVHYVGCKISVLTTECIMSSKYGKDCTDPPTIDNEMKRQLSSAWSFKVHSFIKNTLMPTSSVFTSSTLNTCKGIMEAKGSTRETVYLESRKIAVLSGATFSFSFKTSTAFDYKKINFFVQGKFKIRTLTIDFTLTKDSEKPYATITGTSKGQISFQILLMYFGYQARQFVNVGVVQMPRLSVLIFRDPTIKGCLSEKEGFQLAFSTRTSEKSLFKSSKVHIAIHMQSTLPDNPVLFVDLESSKQTPSALLAAVLKKGSNKGITVPMLNSVENNYGFVLAKRNFKVNFGFKNVSGVPFPSQLIHGDYIESGVRLVTAMEIRKYFVECNPGKDFSHVPESVVAYVEIKGISLQTIYKETVNITVGSLLLCLSPDEREAIPQEIFRGDNRLVKMRAIVYNPATKGWKLSIALPLPMKLAYNLVIQEIIVEISKEEKGKPVKYEAIANTELFDKSLQVVITKEGGDYTLVTFAESINLTEAATKLLNDSKITKRLGTKATLQNAKIEITLGENKGFRIMGGLAFKNREVSGEIYTFKKEEIRALAIGFIAKNVDIESFIQQYTNLTIGMLWLSDVTILGSYYTEGGNKKKGKGKKGKGKEEGKEEKGKEEKEKEAKEEDKEGDKNKEKEEGKKGEEKEEEEEEEEEEEDEYSYSTPGLSDLSFVEGFYLKIRTKIPQNCKGSGTCKVIKQMIGEGAEMMLQALIDESGIQMNGSYPAVYNISSNLVFEDITVIMDMRKEKESRQGISAIFKSKSPALKFKALFAVSANGILEMSLVMIGMWEKPFGVDILAVGNLMLKMEYKFGGGMPRLEFGGEVWLGHIGNKKEIKIKCYLGYNPANTKDFYIFASVNKLTYGAFKEAFDLNITDSKALEDSGFPEGLTIAYTMVDGGITLPDFDITIEQGFYLKGKLSIMNFNVSARIQINFPEIMIDAKMTPINIANGLIGMYKSPSKKNEGPMMFVRINQFQVAIKIEGYATFLGTSRLIVIHISNQGFKFTYAENLFFGLFQMNVTVEASWGILQHSMFRVEACVSASIEELGKKIIGILREISDMASRAIDKANAKLESARAAFYRAQAKVNSWKGSVSRYRSRLEARKRELEDKKRSLQYSCRSRCGTVCIGTFGWKSRCWKCAFWWVGCPTWISCKWRVPNYFCLAGCELNKLGNQIAIWAERLGINILIGLTRVADFALSAANAVIGLASYVIDFAKGVLSFVKAAVQLGTFLGEQLLKFAANIFNLDYLCMRAGMERASKMCMSLDLKCRIFGENLEYHGESCSGGDNGKKIAQDTVKKKYPKSTEMKSKVAESEKKISQVDSKERELANKENGAQKEVNKLSKRYHVYRLRNNDALREMLSDETEQYSTRNNYMRKVFRESVPWNLNIANEDAFGTEVPLKEGNGHGRKLIPCEGNTSCDQLGSLVGKYSLFRKGFDTLAKSLKKQKESYAASKANLQFSAESLERRAKFIEKTKQVTEEERQDLYYWVNRMKRGSKRYEEKNDELHEQSRKFGIKNFKAQVTFILRSEGIDGIDSYLKELKRCNVKISKRSHIETSTAFNENIEQIHQGFSRIFSSMEDKGFPLTDEVSQWSNMVMNLEAQVPKCA